MDTQNVLAALTAVAQELRLAVFRLLVRANFDTMSALIAFMNENCCADAPCAPALPNA